MPVETNTIADSILRREIFLHRFASFLVNQDVDGTIQSFSRKIPSLLNQFGAAESLTLSERRIVARAVNVEMSKAWTGMWDDITVQMNEMAILDAKHVAGVYNNILGVSLSIPADSILLGHIAQSIMVLTSGKNTKAGVWTKFLRDNINAATRQVNGAIWSGYTSDLSNDQIGQNIRGIFNRSTKKYEGGLLNGITRAQSEALVRTGVSHFSNGARDRMYAANTDIIQSRILIATLDNRTTFICMGRNLREWDITDQTYPRLPFHFNERSVYIVRLIGDDPLEGTKPAIGGKSKNADDFKTKFRGKRDLDVYGVKQVAADTTTDDFLRRQPKAFIISTLGKARADLFINKKFSVKRFTDITGRTLTLEQLGV